jgi:hypothetical protein
MEDGDGPAIGYALQSPAVMRATVTPLWPRLGDPV